MEKIGSWIDAEFVLFQREKVVFLCVKKWLTNSKVKKSTRDHKIPFLFLVHQTNAENVWRTVNQRLPMMMRHI